MVNWTAVSTVIAGLALISTIWLGILNYNLSKENNILRSQVNVNNNGINTGIVAGGDVSVGAISRSLTSEVAVSLEKNLTLMGAKGVRIQSIPGDEPFQYAQQIKQYLESKGWKVTNIYTMVQGSQPVESLFITPTLLHVSGYEDYAILTIGQNTK